MKLSMWMLVDRLREYDPEPRIQKGEQVLRSARILAHDTVIERQNVYLAPASEFISGETNRIICVHGQDMILLNADDMNEVLNCIFDAFDYYNSWADDLAERIRQGCGMQEIIDRSQDIFRQPILVYNADNEVIGMSSNYPRGSLDREWDHILENRANSMDFLINMQDILKQQRTIHSIQRLQVPGTPYPSVYKGLYYERAWLGRIILLEIRHPLSQGEMQLFRTFCDLTERWTENSYRLMKLREEAGIFREMLEGQTVLKEEMDHKLQMAGWKPEDPKKLFRLEIPQQEMEIRAILHHRLEQSFPDCYAISTEQAVFILADLAITGMPVIQEHLEGILRQANLFAVASYSFTDVFKLGEYNEQCTLTALHCPRISGQIYDCSDYALECIHSFLASKVPGVLKHPLLEQLQAYDQLNNSELYETLFYYLRCSCNMAETARRLHLHRNSLLYRINQIREIYEINLENADVREHLLFSYYLG